MNLSSVATDEFLSASPWSSFTPGIFPLQTKLPLCRFFSHPHAVHTLSFSRTLSRVIYFLLETPLQFRLSGQQVFLAKRLQVVAVVASAVPLSNLTSRTFAQINVHLLFGRLPSLLLPAGDHLRRHVSSFCTISLLLLVMLLLLLSLFSPPCVSSNCQAALPHVDGHMMADGPRLQLDVDGMIFTWHVLVLDGMCRIAFL